MTHALLLALLMLAPSTRPAQTSPTAPMTAFGETMETEGAATPVEDVMATPAAHVGRTLRLEGKVAKVCQTSGCWMELGGAGVEPLFVKFTCPVEGRLIPADAVGRRAVVEGQLVAQQISQADARHIAEEAGASPEEIAAINGQQTQYTLRSPAALLAAE